MQSGHPDYEPLSCAANIEDVQYELPSYMRMQN